LNVYRHSKTGTENIECIVYSGVRCSDFHCFTRHLFIFNVKDSFGCQNFHWFLSVLPTSLQFCFSCRSDVQGYKINLYAKQLVIKDIARTLQERLFSDFSNQSTLLSVLISCFIQDLICSKKSQLVLLYNITGEKSVCIWNDLD
jgi:hypothetical protein